MYKIIINRLYETAIVRKEQKRAESSTTGILQLFSITKKSINPLFTCITIENGGESTNTCNKDKRILPGEYYIKLEKTTVALPVSAKGNGWMLYSDTLKDFHKRRIFIHSGNYPQDTEGCILLNSNTDLIRKSGFGIKSNDAVKSFMDILAAAKVATVPLFIKEVNTLS